MIGVAADVKNKGLAQRTQAQLYLPFPQLPWADMNLLVRTMAPPQSITSAVRAQISAMDPDQPMAGIQTVDELLDSSRAEPRFIMLLLGLFSHRARALRHRNLRRSILLGGAAPVRVGHPPGTGGATRGHPAHRGASGFVAG